MHGIDFIQDLAVILAVAALVGWACQRIGLSVVVGFLAAGIVVFTRGEVKGLTTGAGMWLAGAIGLASGLVLWQVAGFATLLTVVALAALGLMQTQAGDEISDSVAPSLDALARTEAAQQDPESREPPVGR